jgi:hypothetical protein
MAMMLMLPGNHAAALTSDVVTWVTRAGDEDDVPARERHRGGRVTVGDRQTDRQTDRDRDRDRDRETETETHERRGHVGDVCRRRG